MKRTTTFLAAGLVGVSGFTSVAYAQDATLYGRITTGIYYSKSDAADADATWDLGSFDAGDLDNSGDKLWSRIGVRASYDLGNGMTSGLHLEKRLDNFRTRHQNAWLQGPFGRLTLGQQGSPYYGAVTWDGANLFGGPYDPGPRRTGVTFATMMDGPFNASVMIQDNNANKDKKNPAGQGEGLDNYEIAASFNLGDAFTLSAGYLNPDGDDNDGMGFSVQGSVADFSWDVGYTRTDVAAEDAKNSVGTETITGGLPHPNGKDEEFKEGSPSKAAVDAGTTTAYGVHVGYAGAYGQYGRSKKNNDNDNVQDEDSVDYWIVGYSHLLGPNTRLILEYKNEDEDANTAALALRVDF